MPVEIRDGGGSVHHIVYRGRVTDDEVARVIARVDELVAAGEPFGLVVDPTTAEPLNAAQRKMLANTFERGGSGQAATLYACGVVIQSNVTRGILTALSWMASPRFPMEMFSTLADAERWVRGRRP